MYNLTDTKPSKLDQHKEQITIWLEEAPYSAMRIWEKVQEQGFTGRYTTTKHFVRGKKEQLHEKATVRFETMPGQQAKVDWAFFEDHVVLEVGKLKKLYCFLTGNQYSVPAEYVGKDVAVVALDNMLAAYYEPIALHQISYQKKDKQF